MVAGEVLNPAATHHQAFGSEQRRLHLGVPAIAAECTPFCHDPVVGQAGPTAGPHECADRTRGPRSASQGGDVAVGRHLARRDPAHGL